MGEMRNAYSFWLGNLKRTDHSEDLGVAGKIISDWILWEQGRKV
jgi:hypothetical protein